MYKQLFNVDDKLNFKVRHKFLVVCKPNWCHQTVNLSMTEGWEWEGGDITEYI